MILLSQFSKCVKNVRAAAAADPKCCITCLHNKISDDKILNAFNVLLVIWFLWQIELRYFEKRQHLRFWKVHRNMHCPSRRSKGNEKWKLFFQLNDFHIKI